MTGWIIDKSAFVRLNNSPDLPLWIERIDRGLVAITSISLLEIGFSARGAGDHFRLTRCGLAASLVPEFFTPAIEDRALDVQALLAAEGQHRAPSIPDLLIAATAELTNRTVLHLDKDFELIASYTRQGVERLRL
ncbi:MAG: PIN domain nuclease [Actinomycetaceae bacterium]|nr:PIN domain nuclease [Actinomycetaceae bacterium]